MFKLIKSLIWLVGLAVVAYAILRYFGYDINFDYLKDNKAACEERLQRCRAEFFAKGYENPECQIVDCVQESVEKSKIIIKRK